jgi:hypothetical protein
VIEDEGGDEARRFGVVASGHLLVYSADGRRLFSGGITSSRGHEGDSDGKSMVLDLLKGNEKEMSAAVYGCSLFEGGESDGSAEGKR